MLALVERERKVSFVKLGVLSNPTGPKPMRYLAGHLWVAHALSLLNIHEIW
jgi:hypothetical protein